MVDLSKTFALTIPKQNLGQFFNVFQFLSKIGKEVMLEVDDGTVSDSFGAVSNSYIYIRPYYVLLMMRSRHLQALNLETVNFVSCK